MKYLSILVATLLLTNCSSDVTDPSAKCSDQELYDQLVDKCVPRLRDVVDMGPAVDIGNKMTDMDTKEPDLEEDTGPNLPDPECDKDFDGALSQECGGNDCDDSIRQMSPAFPEVCDEFDNNCDGIINNGINCSFFAHTGRNGDREPELYRVDPFLKTAKPVGESITIPGNGILLDIDTHPDGVLYGVTDDKLFKFNENDKKWTTVGSLGRDIGATGLAIDNEGTAFITARFEVYTVNLSNGEATVLGEKESEFFSSGDAVVNKQDTLYMSAKDNGDSPESDVLVQIDRATGEGTAIGSTGFFKIFGLTSGWGELWGLTASGTREEPKGELIKIDPNTGKGTLVHTFEGVSWYGAASDPNR